jgi:hypothetical protein
MSVHARIIVKLPSHLASSVDDVTVILDAFVLDALGKGTLDGGII